MDFQRYNIREKQKEKGRKKEKKKERKRIIKKQINKQTIKKKKKPSTTIQRLYMVFALKKKKSLFKKQTKKYSNNRL